MTALLQAQDGLPQDSWQELSPTELDNASTHVRVSPTTLTSPLQQELLTLTSPQWIPPEQRSLEHPIHRPKTPQPNGTTICEQLQLGNPLATITDVPPHVPHAERSPHATTSEAVVCSVSTTAIATCRVPQTPFSFPAEP